MNLLSRVLGYFQTQTSPRLPSNERDCALIAPLSPDELVIRDHLISVMDRDPGISDLSLAATIGQNVAYVHKILYGSAQPESQV